MIKKLYVGGLSFNTTDETLGASFAQAGTVVSAIVIKDKFSGRSKGFGFVEMNSEEEAQAAIEMWNDKELDGRAVKVNEARPMEDRPPRRDNFSRGGNDHGGFGGGRSGGSRY
ncbi:MAG: RNA-binding protein [Candidatus Shapirobacteria bacterium]|nr:RNA-binding protein [Candidatus Shapirobacteria bacterium]